LIYFGYCSGIELDELTLGAAYVGGMCDKFHSVSFTQDGGNPLSVVTSTAAHEMGHNFNMRHDDGINTEIITK